MNNGACIFRFIMHYSFFGHELGIADKYFSAFNNSLNTKTSYFLHISRNITFYFFTISSLQRHGNRMVRMAFRQSCQLQKLFSFHVFGDNLLNIENPFSQSACFIKNDNLRLGQSFEIIAALDQNALSGSPSYTAEEAERN
ncbi:hypothetical protein SDC9_103054 [bioreactor metagenome]|uniref:Uncharacterized protein n=1 Tax=bioreactor metagenome TaxID=1076179 RepID=A0A645ASK7_9ZZZZ